MRIYIAGRITGDLNYRDKFKQAEVDLITKGHTPINPAKLPDGLGGYDEYMRICRAMIDVADGIYFLSDWQESKGAKLELEYGEEKGKIFFYQEVLSR